MLKKPKLEVTGGTQISSEMKPGERISFGISFSGRVVGETPVCPDPEAEIFMLQCGPTTRRNIRVPSSHFSVKKVE